MQPKVLCIRRRPAAASVGSSAGNGFVMMSDIGV